MYFLDHSPPHFHAVYQEFVAEYDIHTIEILTGSLPKRAHILVTEWAKLNQEALLLNWEKTQTPEPLDPIKPLE